MKFVSPVKSLCVAILCIITTTAHATKYIAASSGNFNSTGTWAGGVVPPAIINDDTIAIGYGVAVTLDVDLELLNPKSSIDMAQNASIVSGTNPHYIALYGGKIKGSKCTIDIDSIYLGASYYSFDGYSGSLTVEKLEDNAGIWGSPGMTVTINKIFRVLSGVQSYNYCSINLTPVPRTTVIYSGGTLFPGAFDMSKPFNVRYEDPNYNIDKAPELQSKGITDIDIAIGLAPNIVWHYTHDLEVRGKLMFTSGLVSLSGGNNTLTLGPDASVDFTSAGGMQFLGDTKLLVKSTLNNIGNWPPSPISHTTFIARLAMNSANPKATLYIHGDYSITKELDLHGGILTPVNSELFIDDWPGKATIYGGGKDSYVNTEHNGILARTFNNDTAISTLIFPVGTDKHYAPVDITAIKSPLLGWFIEVSVKEGVHFEGEDTNSYNFALSKPVVNATWYIRGLLTNTSAQYRLDFGWDTTMEVNNFNRNSCYGAFYGNPYGLGWNPVSSVQSAIYNNINDIYIASSDTVKLVSGDFIRGPFAIFDSRFVSVKQPEIKKSLMAVYPNPATNVLFVSNGSDNETLAVIYNSLGTKVKELVISSKLNRIDISSLSTGTYFIHINEGDKVTVHEFIKS